MGSWFSTRLRRARRAQGISQGFLAKKAGVSQATVSNWEKGKGKPDDAELQKLTTVLGKFDAAKNSALADGDEDEIADGKAFGDWLRKAREDAEMTAHELSEASGVSQVQIYNLETGRSSNPRPTTRKRLEKALKASVPDDVKEDVEEEQSIEGLGQLTDFDPHDVNDRPSCSGVYVFYDVSQRPVYVGKAKSITTRVKDHEEKFWFKRPIVDNAAYVEITDETLRHQVEQVLIKFLKSNAVINKQSVERDDE
ncbi:MAG: helix-turn-helix domain-containing protein [Deltaproteobacteria bacterium]|nr:helix-turn-helix domain-containing protein [Deltaproteobacteria bacterium]